HSASKGRIPRDLSRCADNHPQVNRSEKYDTPIDHTRIIQGSRRARPSDQATDQVKRRDGCGSVTKPGCACRPTGSISLICDCALDCAATVRERPLAVLPFADSLRIVIVANGAASIKTIAMHAAP